MRSSKLYLVLALAGFCMSPTSAQISLGDDFDARPRSYNLKWGEAYFDFTAVGRVEWDSNFNRAADPESGTWIFSKGVLTHIFWQPLPYLRLDTDVEITYVSYSGEGGEDGVRIRGGPDSGEARLSFDLLLADSIVQFFADAKQDFEAARLANQSEEQENTSFEQLNYSLGIRYKTELTPYTRFESSYTFGESKSRSAEFEALDKQRNTLGFVLSTALNESMRVGIAFRPSWTRHSVDERTDFVNYASGLTGSYTSAAGATVRLGLGFDYLVATSNSSRDRFDDGIRPRADAAIGWISLTGWEYLLSLSYLNEESNVIAERMGGAVVRSRQKVVRSAFELKAPLTPELLATGTIGLSQAEDEGSGASRSSYDVGLRTDYRLSPKWTIGSQYDYTNQFKADDAGLEFDQHKILLSLAHSF